MAAEALQLIQDFLSQRRIAVVGVSRNPSSFSRKLFQEFRRQGYDAVPVNPNTPELEGLPCYPHVQAIRPAVDGALLLTSREGTYHALIDCEEAGIRRVWLYGLNGPKEVSVGAMEFCASHGISVVPGYCPLMFLPERGIVHRLHGAFMKLTGSYPR